jgi:hypothetical protein
MRKCPDLEEVDGLGAVLVLRVPDTSAGGCHLEVAALEDLDVAHRVATSHSVSMTVQTHTKRMCSLLEFAIHEVREDLELSVRMRSKARLRRNAVLVDDSEGTELGMLSLVIA